MADIDFSCDQNQGFNFNKTEQSTVGDITSFKVGNGEELAKDLNINKPTDSSAVAVVGVCNNLHWGGGYIDNISFSCQVSVPNTQAINTLLHSTLEDTSCTFGITIYMYDQIAKKYDIALQGSATDGTPLNGLIKKSGQTLIWTIDQSPGPVQSPMNYGMAIELVPQDAAEQGITFATADQKNVAKKWGRKVGAA